MNDTNLSTISQIKNFLKSSTEIDLVINDRKNKYEWLQRILIQFKYRSLLKKDRGYIRCYIEKFTNYSTSQITRLIDKHYKESLSKITYKRNVFPKKYTPEDIMQLVYTDEVHKRLSGLSTKEIFRRECEIFNNDDYIRLKDISVSHIYNLRAGKIYLRNAVFYTKTNPTNINIGIRTKPNADGNPGLLRIDTVHQGDQDGEKGVYYINVVDEVTQWEVIVAVPAITWEYMKQAFEDILEQYPFEIFGFHSDNGSEYINHEVAKMLNKLNIQHTKSRARRTNDNALVESKNGSIIRKHMGYAHIPRSNADLINKFYKRYFNLYLNYHRPCLYPTIETDKKGKQRKKYKESMIPYEKLKSLEKKLKKTNKDHTYLKPNITFEYLDKLAYAMSDNLAAQEMMNKKIELFKNIRQNIAPSH